MAFADELYAGCWRKRAIRVIPSNRPEQLRDKRTIPELEEDTERRFGRGVESEALLPTRV